MYISHSSHINLDLLQICECGASEVTFGCEEVDKRVQDQNNCHEGSAKVEESDNEMINAEGKEGRKELFESLTYGSENENDGRQRRDNAKQQVTSIERNSENGEETETKSERNQDIGEPESTRN